MATQIVQSLLWASQTITFGYPTEALPNTEKIPAKYLKGMEELEHKRPKEVRLVSVLRFHLPTSRLRV